MHSLSEGDHYQVLGIPPSATDESVRRAYRLLARELHPDVNGSPDAAQRFSEVTRAYRVLSDPAQRRIYDQQRRAAQLSSSALPAAARGQGQRGSMPPRGVLRGRDVCVAVTLSLRDAVAGVVRPIEVSRREVCALCVGSGAADGGVSMRCPRCLGSGNTRAAGEECPRCLGSGVIGDPPCPNCGGAGRRQGRSELRLTIPPGVEDGQRLVIKGEGDAGPRNGPRGDLLVQISVEPDPQLRRAGIDILMDLTISADEARTGTVLEVPSLKGPRRLRIPGGAYEGQILRIGGAGIRLPGMLWHRGDQFVTLHIGVSTAAEP